MVRNLDRNSPERRRRGHRWKSRSPSPTEPVPRKRAQNMHLGPRPYMKQVKLHPSGCQQWSSQVVTGGGIYVAYASTLTIYIYDVRDFSLVTILGGNGSSVQSVLWHTQNPHRLLLFSVDGHGTQWDVRSEEKVAEYAIGVPLVCAAWDPLDAFNLAAISRGSNAIHLLGNHAEGKKDARAIIHPRRHDPNGGEYLLVAYHTGCVVLWNTAAHSSIASFERCAVGLVGVRWMAWASGNFLTLSSKTGVARVFNISQTNTMIGAIRLGETGSGVRDMAWLPWQNEDSKGPSAAQGTGPKAICGFRDGSLSVIDTKFGGNGIEARGRRDPGTVCGPLLWASKAGHVETVFSCAHKPRDASTLATGSYGSNVKVWHTPTMDLKMTLAGQTGAIYSVAWSVDGNKIASSSRDGTVWIWDAESGKAEQRLHLHSQAAHRVQWDPFNPRRLASVGADKRLVTFNNRGTVERSYNHPSALFGCHWSPSYPDVIATGCQDTNVRIFDVSPKGGVQPLFILSGHSERVFNVSWSPLLHGTLASGSDDRSIIIWCLGSSMLQQSDPPGKIRTVRPSAVLRGHTHNVRPLHWNSEIPWLLLSGSWDGTIRAWDIRRAGIRRADAPAKQPDGDERSLEREDESGPCIAVMRDHVADVYGLSAAAERPFLYVSVSRDTTVRQFTLEGIVSSVKTRAIIGNSLVGCLGDLKEVMNDGHPIQLCGQASLALQAKLHELRRENSSLLEAPRRIFNFFWASDGVEEFWEVVRWVTTVSSLKSAQPCPIPANNASDHKRLSLGQAVGEIKDGSDDHGGKVSMISLRDLPRGLMYLEERAVHRSARRAWARAFAERLEQSPNFLIHDRRIGRSDRLARAARLYLASGDLRSACEVLIKLGRWEGAMAMAPGVGIDYWRELADRYAAFMCNGGHSVGGDGGGEVWGSGAGVGGQSGSEDHINMTPFILVSNGKPMEAINFLQTPEEALTLSISLAEGAFPSYAQGSPADQERLFGLCGEGATETMGKSSSRCDAPVEGGDRALRGSLSRGDDAKLLNLIELSNPPGAKGDEGEEGPRLDSCRTAEGVEEGKASPKEGIPGRKDIITDRARDDLEAFVHREDMHLTQREGGETAIRSMTQSAASKSFAASQSALAGAILLSLCDGTREAMADALSLLIRAEEPDLAFAAARVLRFPERELRPLVREMARRAEAWGDSCLAVELLSDIGGEDDSDTDGALRGDGEEKVVEPSGFWPTKKYGTAGEDTSSRAAATIASRERLLRDMSGMPGVHSFSRTNDKLGSILRSKASYLDDAESALQRGKQVEAVRLFVLGGDMERAASIGISFLYNSLAVSPPRSPSRTCLSAALAVIRALGSGPPLSRCVAVQTQKEVLAYASYLGALEAAFRGYHPVVALLLRNACVCVQAAETLKVQDIQSQRKSLEEDAVVDAKACSPPFQSRKDQKRELGSREGELFPPCMSTGALVVAMVRHLTARLRAPSHGGNEDGLSQGEEQGQERDAALKIARRLREEEELPAGDERSVEVLVIAAQRRPSSTRASVDRTVESESNRTENQPGAGELLGPSSRRPSDTKDGCPRSLTDAFVREHGEGGEIIMSGSRLPSCRRHGTLAWGVRSGKRGSRDIRNAELAAAEPGYRTLPSTRGATFVLEDGETGMGLSNAMMWAKVNPFSPLNTGYRIMPF